MESRSGLMEGSYEEEHPRTTSPLLRREGGGEDREAAAGSSSLTWLLVFSNFVVASGSFANGCALGFSSPAQDGIMKELGLSIAEYSVFGSISTIGGMLGAIISGKVADLIGRKHTIFLMQIFCILGWLAIIFAQGAWLLDFGRLSIGFGLGLYAFVTTIYVAEITPKDIRGAFASVNQVLVSGGISLMFLLGNLIHWHILAVIGVIPCVLQIIGSFFIPESPRWLAKIGREKEVETTLRRLRGKNVDISQEAAEIRYFMENLQQLPESSFLDLFQRKYAHSVIVGVGLMLLVQLGGYNGVSFYASSIFEAAGLSSSVGTTAVGIIQIPFSLMGVLLMDKIGRRALLKVTAAGACLGSFLAGLAFLLQDFELGKEFSAMLMLSGMLVYFSSYSGLGGLPWLIMSEIFPMNIKGSAGSLVTLACWISSWIVTYAFNFLFKWSPAGVFFIFASICGSIVIFSLKLVPETKGRTLEEIQASMVQLFA
ncbi:sugar transporter ERD6-like 5 isoform X3 [Diospyros lotus]|uniref:sugar transporter ERD6-like 5 isoform X3 n=1 Tax=Diospyros lotus TaxID=55363 RepID=UPI00225BA96C|nr:sugar transporter ERD6-like 5 isoform X3 [Diospyros lotus]